MFTVKDIEELEDATGTNLCVYRPTYDEFNPIEGNAPEFQNFVEHLNEFTKTFMPQGAPSLTLSKKQAEILRDLLAPGWAMHMVKITAFEELAHLPMYANLLGTPKAYDEVRAAREAVQQIEYVLSSLTMQRPVVEPSNFIQFAQDPHTKQLAPMYNHMMALQYAEKLARAWQTIEVFDEGEAN